MPFIMDAIGSDLQLSDRAYSDYQESRSVDPGGEQDARSSENDSSSDTIGGSSHQSSASLSDYQFSSDLATGTTVPVGDSRASRVSKTPSSSTSSNSSTDSQSRVSASLYLPEYLTPSISYDRQSGNQLLIALIGREFDQPVKLASLLQLQVSKFHNTEIPVAKFIPFTVKRKALCRGNFESDELKKHNLICLCYNASEARILLTGQDGYYTSILKQIEILMGSNKVAFLVSNYNPPHKTVPDTHSVTLSDSPLIPPALRTRLSLQPGLAQYLLRGQVLAWTDQPMKVHAVKLIEIARLEPNPQGILSLCSLM